MPLRRGITVNSNTGQEYYSDEDSDDYPSHPPPIPQPKPVPQSSEPHTISEDRSAGSNLEKRNLAALEVRTNPQNEIEGKSPFPASAFNPSPTVPPISTFSGRYGHDRKDNPVLHTGELSIMSSHLQQRFGRLPFDEEHPHKHIDDVDQRILEENRFTAGFSASHNYLRPLIVGKHDWVEDIEQIDAGSEIQANIETLQQNLASMQKELGELEAQKQKHANKQFLILYRIEGTCYFDHPEWTQRHESIVSRTPVRNLDLYLERNKEVVFIVYRDFHRTPPKTGAKNKLSLPQHMSESIHPVSQQLRNTLQMLLKYDWRYHSMFWQLRRKKEIHAPYLFIYHHRSHWKDMLAACLPTVREHLNLLARYVSGNYGEEYVAADAMFAQRKVSTHFIKYLFQPGDILISRSEGQYRGLVARSWPQENAEMPARPARASGRTMVPELHEPHWSHMEQLHSEVDFEPDSDTEINVSEENMRSPVETVELKDQDFLRQLYGHLHTESNSKKKEDSNNDNAEASDEEISIDTWQWSFDGDFKRVEGKVVLRLSQSTLSDTTGSEGWNMHDLNVYPLRFAPQSLVQTLRRRGVMSWQCRKRCLVSYHESNAEAQDESDERFMIDVPTFRKLHSENSSYVIAISVETMTQAEMEKETPPDETFYYLVPLQTKGFNLRTKKWLDLNMDQIGPVIWNEKAFDSLVLNKDRKTKELITALVSKQISPSKSTDVIAGKGNGLILLLHGGPGTGKTLTAESVAELAKKPLYRVTCGDVGTKAEEVEKYLESVLHLGKLWDCVVLLDEAEVFLERRSLDDLQRNALVSVFLRVIEYHEGILILTSNRVGTFDEAFRSRIQIAVHYPPLRAYQRQQIWRNFFDRLESFKDGSVDVDELRDHLEELQAIEINGRQIRNAITTARQYADWKGKIMTFEHLRIALDVAAEFNDYSEKLRGGLTDDQIADEEGIR
ncbi:hypothetical protein HBI65_122520 [Parastagonospora nodorum]|nr:hypothetical protein HBI65_122520 [Parastagonospora nodorum]